MTENLNKRPPKSILKSSSSFSNPQPPSQEPNTADEVLGAAAAASSSVAGSRQKSATFDEMNIIETLHPADKDYGFMKIEEPKTPFSYLEDNSEGVDAEILSERLTSKCGSPPKAGRSRSRSESESSEDCSPEDQEERKVFQAKRKAHYNEYYAVKSARKLMEEEEEDEEEDEEGQGRIAEKFIPQEEAEVMEDEDV